MSHSAHIAAARESSWRKLHENSDNYETREDRIEPSRITPLKIPTAVIATTGKGTTCAGRNSVNRYLRATGLSGVEVETTKKTNVYGVHERKPVISYSVVKLPVKVPGKGRLRFVMVPILDKKNKLRDLPIRLSEDMIPCAEDCYLYPLMDVPKAGKVYDLFPFPAEADCYDESQTKVYTKEEVIEELSKEDIEQELAEGIVYVVFRKRDGDERTLRGTTNRGFIPTRLHGRSNEVGQGRGAKKIGEDQIVVFDVDIQSWRSFRFSSILQLRVRLHPYYTFPGTASNLEEFVNQ